MQYEIQFIGDKIKVIEHIPEYKITKAQAVLDSAISGELQFAWRQLKEPKRSYPVLKKLLRRDPRTLVGQDYADVQKHRRAEKWNLYNAYDPMSSGKTIKQWKRNLNTLKNALETLYLSGILSFYHVDGVGRMEIVYSANGDRVKLGDCTASRIFSRKRGKMPENELSARRKGKLHFVDPFEAEQEESPIAKKKAILRELQLKRLSKTMDVCPKEKGEEKVYHHVIPVFPEQIPIITSETVYRFFGTLESTKLFEQFVDKSNEMLYCIYYPWEVRQHKRHALAKLAYKEAAKRGYIHEKVEALPRKSAEGIVLEPLK